MNLQHRRSQGESPVVYEVVIKGWLSREMAEKFAVACSKSVLLPEGISIEVQITDRRERNR